MRLKPLLIVPGVHEIIETELVASLRTELRCPALFSYYHTQKNVWVIAEWLDEHARVCIEYSVLGPDLENPLPGTVDCVRWHKSPEKLMSLQRLRNEIASEVSSEENRLQDAMDEELEFVEFLRQKSNAHYADHPEWALV